MRNVSDSFIEALNTYGRMFSTRLTYIDGFEQVTVVDGELIITSRSTSVNDGELNRGNLDTVSGKTEYMSSGKSSLVDYEIYSTSIDTQGGLFRTVESSFDLELHTDFSDLKGKEITVELGVKAKEEDAFEYITMGIYYVYSTDYSYRDDKTTLECYDLMIYSHDVIEDLTDISGTPIDIINTVVNYINSQYGANTYTFSQTGFVNSTLTITDDTTQERLKALDNVSYRDVLDYVAQITGSTIVIDKHELRLFYPGQQQWDREVEFQDGENQSECVVGTKIGPINAIEFTGSIPTVDDDGNTTSEEYTYTRIDSSSISDNGQTTISFSDNPFISDTSGVLDNVFASTDGLTYYNVDMTTFGTVYLNILDKVRVWYNDIYYDTYFMCDTLNMDGGLTEQFVTDDEEESSTSSDDSYSVKSSTTRQINSAIQGALGNLTLDALKVKDLTTYTANTTLLNALVANITNGYTNNAVAKALLANALTANVAEIGSIKGTSIKLGEDTIYDSFDQTTNDKYQLNLVGSTINFRYYSTSKHDYVNKIIIGRHEGEGNYNITIYGDYDVNTGECPTLFDATGVTFDGLTNSNVANVINNDGYSDLIKASRLDVDEVVNVINNGGYLLADPEDADSELWTYLDANNQPTTDITQSKDKKHYVLASQVVQQIQSSVVNLDKESQTLDVIFNKLTNYLFGSETLQEVINQTSYTFSNGLFSSVMSDITNTKETLGYDLNGGLLKDSSMESTVNISNGTLTNTAYLKYDATNTCGLIDYPYTMEITPKDICYWTFTLDNLGVTVGTYVIFSIDFKGTNIERVKVLLEFLDSNEKSISTSTQTIENLASANEWTRYSTINTAIPDGTEKIRILLNAHGKESATSTDGILCYFRNLMLSKDGSTEYPVTVATMQKTLTSSIKQTTSSIETVVGVLNGTIDSSNLSEGEVTPLYSSYSSIQQYVDNINLIVNNRRFEFTEENGLMINGLPDDSSGDSSNIYLRLTGGEISFVKKVPTSSGTYTYEKLAWIDKDGFGIDKGIFFTSLYIGHTDNDKFAYIPQKNGNLSFKLVSKESDS